MSIRCRPNTSPLVSLKSDLHRLQGHSRLLKVVKKTPATHNSLESITPDHFSTNGRYTFSGSMVTSVEALTLPRLFVAVTVAV